MLLKQVNKILSIGMPVADVLINGAKASEIMHNFNMKAGERNMLSASEITQIEEDISSISDDITIVAGGSLANTMCAIAGLTDNVISFFAAIAADNYGKIFQAGLLQAGINHQPTTIMGTETSRSYVITEEGGERAIARHLGDSMSNLQSAHLHEAIKSADLILLEGELPSLPNGKDLWLEILHYAKTANKLIGFSLFGAEQVAKHRDLFKQTIDNYADLIFGNEAEVQELLPNHDFKAACAEIANIALKHNKHAIICLSHGANAPHLQIGSDIFSTPPKTVAGIVNTLGAGDGFMAGTLAGLLNGLSGDVALELGHTVAANVLQQASPQLSRDKLANIRKKT
jgi:sugar/nucleoside kinase (ribokinase family)